MCGIAGYSSRLENYNSECIKSMLSSIEHRGPDDSGIYSDGFVMLGHRRLSVIDLSEHGHQPMANEDGTVWVAFNGEVYNFKELRTKLKAKGHIFKSNTDTEVIVHGFEEFGEDLFAKLNGMFAAAIWDKKQKKLVLVRDRYGQKPLYYSLVNNALIFASELKALLKHPAVQQEIDPVILRQYFFFEHVPYGKGIYKDTYKLKPGSYLVWQNNRATIKEYWNIKLSTSNKVNVRDCVSNTEKLLTDSIARHFVADVPVGVFLSGGIDSSLITALSAKLYGPEKIEAFSIGFEDKSFDESGYAKEVASSLGVRHHVKTLSTNEILDVLPKAISLLDEPFADSSFVPTYVLSKFAKERVTVALGGDGGDELFAGYDPFVAYKLSLLYDRFPGFARKGIECAVNSLPVSHSNMSFDFKAKQFLKGLNEKGAYRNQRWLAAFRPEEHAQLFNSDFYQSAKDYDFVSFFDQNTKPKFDSGTDELIWSYVNYYLAEGILTKVDRASMAVSLETRAPLLDVELSEYVNSLPGNVKLKGFKRKWLLKQISKQYLPKQIVHRKKKGFGMPIGSWMQGPLKDYLISYLNYERIKQGGIFNPKTVCRVVDEHMSGKRDNRKQLWSLLVFEVWRSNCETV